MNCKDVLILAVIVALVWWFDRRWTARWIRVAKVAAGVED